MDHDNNHQIFGKVCGGKFERRKIKTNLLNSLQEVNQELERIEVGTQR